MTKIKAIAVIPGTPNSMHLAEIDMPSVHTVANRSARELPVRAA